MSGPVRLRPLTADDLAQVQRIEEAVSPDPWSPSLFADELADPGHDRRWLVAEDGRSVVGFGGLLFVVDEAHIMNLAVSPGHQRRGIAAALAARLLLEAGDRGAVSATLEVRAANEAALGLYDRLGFSRSGRRPRYYPDGEDAVIMWAHRIHRVEYRRMLSRTAERATGYPAPAGGSGDR